jgi:hypothetical protein
MRGFVTIVCLAAILAIALTPTAFDWFAALIAPVILLAEIMPELRLETIPLHHLTQPQSLLYAVSGRAPPVG